MAALVQRDACELGRLPHLVRPAAGRGGVEEPSGCRRKDVALEIVGARLVRHEEVSEDGRDGDQTRAVVALWLHLACLGVPASLDADRALRQVNVAPAERAKLASAQARIERRGPERAVIDAQASIRRAASSGVAIRSRRPRTAGSSNPLVGLIATSPRVHGAAEDRSEWHVRVPDRGRVGTGCEHPVGQVLHIVPARPLIVGGAA